MKNYIITILGKSGAGKTSIAKEVSKLMKLPVVVSTTSRPMREGEVDGVDYYFKSEKEMIESFSRGDFVEFVDYNGWFYGVEKKNIESLGENCIVVVEPYGYSQFAKIYGSKVIPIMIETSDKKRLLRSLSREINPNCSEICRRLIADTKDFKHIEEDDSIHKISNDSTNIEDAIKLACDYIYTITQ